MAKFQVYDNQNNVWSDKFTLISGWNINLVQDKTTDSAKVKLKYDGMIPPNWKSGDWCRILPDNENAKYDLLTTYRNDELVNCYVPKNHKQFIIKDKTFVVDEINDEIDIQLTLGEPIELAQGIICETMSFTNQIQKTFDGVVYKHEALNFENVLRKILKVTPANFDENNSWYSRIKILDYDFLKNTPFNDDTFSEPSLYDILMNKFDSLLGRTPVMFFDINGTTDLPFNTERPEYILQFQRQDGFDKEEVNISTLKQNCSEVIVSENFGNKADGIVSNIGNLAPNTKPTFISDYLWAVPEIDSDQRNISGFNNPNNDKGIWVLKTPHKIKQITKLTRLKIEGFPFSNVYELIRKTEDLTDLVKESKEYKASDQYDTRNVIWFEEGTNIIHLNDFYYQKETSSFYRIEYQPLVDMRYADNKDYNIIINQVDGQVSENRLSKYIEDYFKSMNKSDLIIQKTYDENENIVPLGTRVIDGEKLFLITNISIQNRGFDNDVVYQLNENHFRKNDSIIAPQNIRKDLAISYSGLTDRKSCIIVDFDLSIKNPVNNKHCDIFDMENNCKIARNKLFNSISTTATNDNTLHQANNEVQLAEIQIKSFLEKEDGSDYTYFIRRLCTPAVTILNNTFLFNMKYQDNAICGKSKTLYNQDMGLQMHSSDTLYLKTSPKSQVPILYTDPFGEIQQLNIRFINATVEQLDNIEIFSNNLPNYENEVNKTNKIINITTDYPLSDGITWGGADINIIADILRIKYYKDMLDTFNYTIGFKINTDNNIILCRDFFKENSMLGGSALLNRFSTYSVNKTEQDLIYNESELKSATSNLGENDITFTCSEQTTNAKSIVFWNDKNNPLIIINDLDKISQDMWDGQILKINC